MSHNTHIQPAPVRAPQRLAVAEVVSRTFTCGGWVPKLRWAARPAVGAKLYTVSDACAPDDTAGCIFVAQVLNSHISGGCHLPELRWLSQPEVGVTLYQDVVADPTAPATAGADYKGHSNLAEMLVTHLGNYRRALQFQRGHAKDADDRAWYDHELATLLDIEAACNADLKGARAVKANVINHQFLSAIDAETKAQILDSIAGHYGITANEAYAEVIRIDAEHLLDYMKEPERRATSVLMKRHGLS